MSFLNRTSKTAKILIIMNVTVFIIGNIMGSTKGTGLNNNYFITEFGLYQFGSSGQYYRILTSAFVHIDLMHLAINMYSLFQLGIMCNYIFKDEEVINIYAFSILTGGLAVLFLSGPNSVTVGASGAILGLFGALGATLYLKTHYVLNRNMYLFNLIFILAYSFAIQGISWQGHVGGFVGGFLIACFILRKHPRIFRR